MAIRYGVQADTRDECMRALTELCERLGARPATPPTDTFGNGWLARAVPADPAAAELDPGQQ
ncbi:MULTISPECIES: hypothetical protein [unclassified Streptomyces]|uniref:hypothetical protein n=1 Tax=unclassified Streptomyces TaxID=2593676 RepID=UPI0004C5F25F|nr:MULTISPECIES: hypothetical protein [unclassified Streptomyces]KOV86077.1 hypothetical protein ADL02_19485 [Streptomyces sp. NRRL WC-3723]